MIKVIIDYYEGVIDSSGVYNRIEKRRSDIFETMEKAIQFVKANAPSESKLINIQILKSEQNVSIRKLAEKGLHI